MKPRRKAMLLCLAAICLLAVGLRCAMAVFVFASTRDTSVVGIMGLHILEGARPLFFYGQAYMGAAEAYLTAAVFSF
ncbi:MAG TPA: hypothetical protein VJ969_08555, partial [Desulfopila sp.]|nr:hypothetical protein [Desulfopila sp.]